MKNLQGKTEILRGLNLGDRVTWFYDPETTTADKQMKMFTATVQSMRIKIAQKAGFLVCTGEIPTGCVIVERVA